jgi:RNA polymerase sigma factor (sigma-70 family)
MPDPAAFAELYAAHLPDARRLALALAGPDAADDIVAEAFTRVLAARARGGGPTGAFGPYLRAVVRNLARDHNAQRARLAGPVDPRAVTVPGAGELAARREELAMVARAFGALPARWRAVLWQTEVEQRPVAELARVSGMTPAAVSALAWRARAGLALAWQRERGDQERLTGPAPALTRQAELKARRRARFLLTGVKQPRNLRLLRQGGVQRSRTRLAGLASDTAPGGQRLPGPPLQTAGPWSTPARQGPRSTGLRQRGQGKAGAVRGL